MAEYCHRFNKSSTMLKTIGIHTNHSSIVHTAKINSRKEELYYQRQKRCFEKTQKRHDSLTASKYRSKLLGYEAQQLNSMISKLSVSSKAVDHRKYPFMKDKTDRPRKKPYVNVEKETMVSHYMHDKDDPSLSDSSDKDKHDNSDTSSNPNDPDPDECSNESFNTGHGDKINGYVSAPICGTSSLPVGLNIYYNIRKTDLGPIEAETSDSMLLFEKNVVSNMSASDLQNTEYESKNIEFIQRPRSKSLEVCNKREVQQEKRGLNKLNNILTSDKHETKCFKEPKNSILKHSTFASKKVSKKMKLCKQNTLLSAKSADAKHHEIFNSSSETPSNTVRKSKKRNLPKRSIKPKKRGKSITYLYNKVLVAIKDQHWLGHPAMISSVRRPLLTKHDKELHAFLLKYRPLLDLDNNPDGNKVDEKEIFMPPYPVHFLQTTTSRERPHSCYVSHQCQGNDESHYRLVNRPISAPNGK